MKKILPILIALILCLSAAAAAEGKGAFRFDEAYDYAMALLEAAQNAGDARKATLEDGLTRLEAGGAVFVYEEGEGYLDLKSATLLNGTEDARGFASGFFGWESVSGVSTAEVLAAYPNGNSRLEGTFDAALIYLERDGGDVLYGLCSRDGQRILSLEYGFDGAKGTALVRYSFLDDSLEDITYYFGDAAQRLEIVIVEHAQQHHHGGRDRRPGGPQRRKGLFCLLHRCRRRRDGSVRPGGSFLRGDGRHDPDAR